MIVSFLDVSVLDICGCISGTFMITFLQNIQIKIAMIVSVISVTCVYQWIQSPNFDFFCQLQASVTMQQVFFVSLTYTVWSREEVLQLKWPERRNPIILNETASQLQRWPVNLCEIQIQSSSLTYLIANSFQLRLDKVKLNLISSNHEALHET